VSPRRPATADVRFYIDADLPGLAKLLVQVRNDVTRVPQVSRSHLLAISLRGVLLGQGLGVVEGCGEVELDASVGVEVVGCR
jgi:hypothetical protein